jgi:hypothetical protein
LPRNRASRRPSGTPQRFAQENGGAQAEAADAPDLRRGGDVVQAGEGAPELVRRHAMPSTCFMS